ncbi:putative oxidoreductase [Coleophoma cylindrospora]|uniref:Putative oxidoreductase n=1 Tax=Coleophoma cylindrospora TaxID=1849047 RepID=A0A3D8Q6G0_9HELO|nr:putative oxidoreductase [Coleophoma cylindrospora]
MRVFVTGATGGIGSALVKELLQAGHTVLGLTRSDAGAEKLQTAGAEPLHGTLADLDLLAKAAAECDAVAHLAFNHNFDDYLGACATDRAAISAMGAALAAAGGNKALIITSGTMSCDKGRVVTEDDGIDMTNPFGASRGRSEALALGFGDQGVRALVMRLPPVVHGDGNLGFVGLLLRAAGTTKSVSYVGGGENRWCAVHYRDAVAAYRLALEKGKSGSIFHGVGEEGVVVKDVAEAMGKKMSMPVVSKTPEEAQEVFGMMSAAIMSDNPASSVKTREALQWTPVHKGLIEDLAGDMLAKFS